MVENIRQVLESGQVPSGSLPPETVSSRPRPDGIPADLSWQVVPEKLRAALTAAVQHNEWPIYIHGEPGRGKSCAMAYVHKTWSAHTRWWSLAAFIDDIQRIKMSKEGYIIRTINGNSCATYASTMWTNVKSNALVCIDDFALTELSKSAYAIIHKLLDARLGNPTIMTGNVKPVDLRHVYDQRIASRALAGTQIEVTGRDLRLAKSKRVKA